MSELMYERIKDNLSVLGMKNMLQIIDNYLERAIADKANIVEVLDHIFTQEAKAKRSRAAESQIQMSGLPFRNRRDVRFFVPAEHRQEPD